MRQPQQAEACRLVCSQLSTILLLLCFGMKTQLVGLPLSCYDPESFFTAVRLCNPCKSFICGQAVLAERNFCVHNAFGWNSVKAIHVLMA